jgi:hypothetical protein
LSEPFPDRLDGYDGVERRSTKRPHCVPRRELNLIIWNTAVHCTQVERQYPCGCLRCTLVYSHLLILARAPRCYLGHRKLGALKRSKSSKAVVLIPSIVTPLAL